MAALKFSASPETYESKNFNFSVNSLQSSDWYSTSPFCGYLHMSAGCLINPFNRLKHIRVSRIDTELSVTSESNQVNDSVNYHDKGSLHEKRPRKIWKRFRGARKGTENVSSRPNSERTDNKQELMFLYKGNNFDSFLSGKNAFYVNLGALGPDLNLDRCNCILKRLERCSDIKALRFFEWMQNNGKLKQNVTAYILALRILARRENWDAAEMMIGEMTTDSGCELNFQVFNTLIYACHKRGLAELGTKWFHMTLDNGVQPNVATFGMLMSLYQKGWNLEEAEFTFSQMRRLNLKCQSAYSAMITIYTRLGLYDKAELVIGFLREDAIVMNKENWLVLLNAYSQQGKLEEAEQYLNLMQDAGFSPNIVAYNTLITGYGKLSKTVAAQRLFQNLGIVGLEPDETTYRSMIEGWGRADNYKETRWFYEELKRSGFKPNSSNLYTMIHLQAKHGDEEGAVITISDMIGMGCQYSSVLGILLKAYERAERFDKVRSIVKGAFYEHVLVNQMSCSILVTFYVKHNLVDDAIKVLQEKKWKDLVFEDNLYHILICSCKEFGYLENAVKIYTQMPKSNKQQNLHIICTMIDIYSIMNLFVEAERLYLKLKSSGTALDMIAYSIVVRMFVKAGALNNACSVLDTMSRRKDIVPDIYLLRDMLRIYQQCGMVDKLADLYYKTLKTGVTWDQEMYDCVINCCARALPVDELSRIFDEMIQRGFVPNTITFNVMLDVLGKSRLFKKAKRVFWMAKKQGLADVISYNTIIAAYGRCKDLKNMSLTVREMQFNGFSVSLEAYNTMLDAYGKEAQMEIFKDVLQRMKLSSCTSDHYTYNIMINIYGEQGWIEEVASVLLELKESGVGPDLCSYNTLIKAYGLAGMVEDAVALVKEMRENGIEPDRITYINLITALRRNDKFLEAVKWSLWMKQMGM